VPLRIYSLAPEDMFTLCSPWTCRPAGTRECSVCWYHLYWSRWQWSVDLYSATSNRLDVLVWWEVSSEEMVVTDQCLFECVWHCLWVLCVPRGYAITGTPAVGVFDLRGRMVVSICTRNYVSDARLPAMKKAIECLLLMLLSGITDERPTAAMY